MQKSSCAIPFFTKKYNWNSYGFRMMKKVYP